LCFEIFKFTACKIEFNILFICILSSVNCIIKTSLTDANDFLFAGKAQSLTDGTTTKTFPTATGYVMKAKTSDSPQNCFSFPSGYSLSL
jgi:hypothetical protein